MPVFYTYDDGNRLEDVQRDIFTITPTDTPFTSGIKKTKAYNTFHQFPEDTLSVRNDNAKIEGGAFSAGTLVVPSRRANFTQIFDKVIQVSSTEQWVKGAGIDNQYAYQLQKATKELATDLETAFLKGSIASGSGSLARRLAGVLNWITTNSTTVASGTRLTESFYNGQAENCWAAGGNVDSAYVGSRLRRAITSFSATNTREIPADDKRLVFGVNVYDGDFGMQKVMLSRDIPNASVGCTLLLIEENLFRFAIGEEVHELSMEEVAQSGHSKMGVLRGECTLEVRAESGNSIAKGLDNVI